MEMLLKSDTQSRRGWKEWIHRLLDYKPDCLILSERVGNALFKGILGMAESPWDSAHVGEAWLEILSEHGVDIEAYLQGYQRTHHKLLPIGEIGNPWNDLNRIIILSESTPRISWDWYVDPEGHAFEVLYEFRYLEQTSSEDQQLEWEYEYPEELLNWPYIYPQWEVSRYALSVYVHPEEEESFVQTFLKHSEDRFERRWLKKMKKLKRAQGLGKRLKMPGAWID